MKKKKKKPFKFKKKKQKKPSIRRLKNKRKKIKNKKIQKRKKSKRPVKKKTRSKAKVILKKNFTKEFNLRGLRIVIDCANGAGYKVGPELLKSLGAKGHCSKSLHSCRDSYR